MDEFKLKGEKNPKIKSKYIEDAVLKFYVTKEELDDPDEFENFIKSCENAIRKDPRYTNYIANLKEHGLNQCTMLSGINDDMAKIEMHHGPVFNLFDICAIVIDSVLQDDQNVSTFDIADIVLTEHEKNNIQVVMLSKTAHELVHAGKVFIHFNQSVGNIMKFIKKYKKGIRREHLYTLEKYISMCEENDATDNDFLRVCKKIEKYCK